jgi:hypothetical protein
MSMKAPPEGEVSAEWRQVADIWCNRWQLGTHTFAKSWVVPSLWHAQRVIVNDTQTHTLHGMPSVVESRMDSRH